MSVGVLLLAAGRSRRFGSDKRYARLANGEMMLESCIRTVQAAGLPLVVCVSAGDTRTEKLLRHFGVKSAACVNSAQGMGATLAESICQVTHWEGALIGLADMPYVSAATFRSIARRVNTDGICVPRYEGKQGHPVGFGRLFFPALAGLGGDSGALKLLTQYASRVRYHDVGDAGILRDIDRLEDLPRWSGTRTG